MLSISKISDAEYERKQKKKIDHELPYFITIVTLLTSAGIGPYFVLQKLKEIELLPTIKNEAQKMLKRIDLLGTDPLEVMSQTKNRASSKGLGDFFDGYVSTVQSGGSVMDYLKSKLKTVFERHAEIEKQSVVKLGALVEAYMTVQIVILAIYIISAALVSQDSISSSNLELDLILLIVSPIVSFVFLFIAHKSTSTKTQELELPKVLRLALPSLAIVGVLIGIGIIPDIRMNPYLIGGAFIAASVWPTITFKKNYTKILAAESATPKILRNITEARKTGMAPEACVMQACKRNDYGLFNPIANGIARKFEFGVSLKNILLNLHSEIKSFHVLINFNILFELISSGGGNTQTLDSLAETSEKIYEIEKNKRDLLRPYLMVGFILMGTTAFTTLLVTDSFVKIAEEQAFSGLRVEQLENIPTLGYFPLVVLVQSWTAGLFLGKVITGAYSGGFQYSIFLVIISLIGITLVQFSIIDVNVIFS